MNGSRPFPRYTVAPISPTCASAHLHREEHSREDDGEQHGQYEEAGNERV